MFFVDISMAAVLIEDRIIFSARNYNALFETTISTGKTRLLSFFEDEDNIPKLHIRAFYYSGEVFFVPLYGKKIACYNVKTNKMRYINLPGNEIIKKSIDFFADSFNGGKLFPQYLDAGYIDAEKFFMVPASRDSIGIFDMGSSVVSSINIESEFDEEEIMGCGTYLDGNIYVSPYSGEWIKCVNIAEKKVTNFSKGVFGKYYSIAAKNNKLYFSATKNNSICYINLDTPNFISLVDDDVDMYREVVNIGDKLWLLPSNNEMLSYLDNNYIRTIVRNIKFQRGIMTHVKSIKSDLYKAAFLSYSHNYFSVINKCLDEESIIIPQIDEDTLYKVNEYNFGANILKQYENNGVVKEEELGLKNFLRII